MDIPEYLTRFIGRRELGEIREVKAPDGITLFRVSWHETRTVGGNYGGWSRDEEIVRWYAYETATGELIGSDPLKKGAIGYAQFALAMRAAAEREAAERDGGE